MRPGKDAVRLGAELLAQRDYSEKEMTERLARRGYSAVLSDGSAAMPEPWPGAWTDYADMLEKIADTYDEEVDNAVSALTSMIEPLMIVFLAVIVGGIVIALFSPLITLIQTLGGG